ncbi:prephenate dehydrogenase [Alloscardovia macacae]|uniref:Prephenate dehydrogenase n=1 Tax=Alloscardovia macacae TaxID=1160091 RepID=A0A261F2I9_9BIFI|nr:prephenate dehydrogenase/arogenate dehydrogenase family protein [Alloscardovia macacae]OZG53136.1 prephenate dehydrogenase [Alloscardovia macacae]
MKVAIAGLGLMGGSLALALVQSGHDVLGWNHRSAPYEQARKNGITCVKTVEELALARPDILILCTPLKAMDTVLGKIKLVLDEHTTLTDVGSVKREVLSSVEKHGLRPLFVGAHPMAGNELAGFEAADAHLYDSATWAITVEEDTDKERVITVGRMITEGVGNRFIVTTAQEHDRAAAQISHMPHVVATTLAAQLVVNPASNIALALAAGSWRDMTRVALTTPERTQAMVEENPDNVADLLRDQAARMTAVADLLAAGDADGLAAFFATAEPYRTVRARLQQGIPEGVYSILLDESWRERLLSASRRGGRVEYIDSVEAHARDFAHLREA